jgi:hypothetical protein
MKTGKTYWGIEPVEGREKRREHIGGEREVALVERGNCMGCLENQCLSIFRDTNQ